MAARRSATITQDSFTVAPHLLGLPLASTRRRAFAMAIDLILVSILIKFGGTLFAFAAAFVLWKFSGRAAGGGMIRGGVRTALRLAAAVVVFAGVVFSIQQLTDGEGGDEENGGEGEEQSTDIQFNASGLNLGITESVRLGGIALAMRDEHDSERAAELADSIVKVLRSKGADARKLMELREAAHALAASHDNHTAREAIDHAFGVYVDSSRAVVAALGTAFATAVQRNDSTAVDTLRDDLRFAISGEELRRLESDKRELESENRTLKRDLDRAREGPRISTLITGAADDLGLGFGWFAVYFTGFLALMRGQTPGKRVAGIRVVRLDARTINWWIAFERFGGYAAAAAVGFLGFLQILWDRNRQGLHDKAVETVVIRDAAKPQ